MRAMRTTQDHIYEGIKFVATLATVFYGGVAALSLLRIAHALEILAGASQ